MPTPDAPFGVDVRATGTIGAAMLLSALVDGREGNWQSASWSNHGQVTGSSSMRPTKIFA